MSKLAAFSVMACVFLVVTGINRGFDVSDEGLYVLLADPRQENVAGIFNYDLIFKLMYQGFGYSFSLIELRILRLVGYLLGALALTGFWKHVSAEPKMSAEVFWMSCLGLFFGYGFLPSTLSYNSLTVVLICGWLYLISKEQNSQKSILILGVILAALVYVKVSVALIFYPLTFLILVLRKRFSLIFFVGLVLPIVISESLFMIVLEENAVTRLVEGIPLTTQRNTYQLRLMIRSILVGGVWMSCVCMLYAGLGYFHRIKSSFYIAMQVIVGYGSLWIGYLTHITDEWNHLILLAFAAFFGYQWGRGTFRPFKTNLWILFLMILPFLLHFGSNVYWLRIGVHYLVFWILASRWLFRNLTWEPTFATIVLSLLLVFNGIWWHPFGHHKPLWSEKVAWEVGGKERIHVDPDLVDIVSELAKVVEKVPNAQLLGAYRIPGLAWLTGATSPQSAAIWEKSQLDAYFSARPNAMIYNKLEQLPEGWSFSQQKELGVFRGDSLVLLWD